MTEFHHRKTPRLIRLLFTGLPSTPEGSIPYASRHMGILYGNFYQDRYLNNVNPERTREEWRHSANQFQSPVSNRIIKLGEALLTTNPTWNKYPWLRGEVANT